MGSERAADRFGDHERLAVTARQKGIGLRIIEELFLVRVEPQQSSQGQLGLLQIDIIFRQVFSSAFESFEDIFVHLHRGELMVNVRDMNCRFPVSQPFMKKICPVSFVCPAAAPGDIEEGYHPSNCCPRPSAQC